MTCYLLILIILVSKLFRWIFQTNLCVDRDMYADQLVFSIINAWSIHPLSRSKVPSPSTRRTRLHKRFGLCLFAGLCFLVQPPPKKETETEEFFTLHHKQASIFLVFFWGAQKNSGNLGIIQAVSIHCSVARFLPQLFAAAISVEKTDVAVDVAEAMVEAVRQAVETTLQKLG